MKNPIVEYVLRNHVLATVLLVALGFLVLQISEILLAVFMAYIIMASLDPFVKILRRYRVPKIIAITIVYAIVIAFIVLLVVPILPFFVSQVQALFKAIPSYLNTAGEAFGFEITKNQINSAISPAVSAIGQNAVSITGKVFGSIFSVLSIFILGFYLLLERERMIKAVPSLFPENKQEKVKETIILIEEKLGAWLRGQIILSLVIGSITWVVLSILGVPFALPLAILAGFLEIIPTLGPIIAAVPAVIVAFAISPVMGGLVAIAYIIIQIAENNIIVPKIMQKAVGLNPVVILIAILIGGNLMGVVGALLSIPLISAAIIIIRALR